MAFPCALSGLVTRERSDSSLLRRCVEFYPHRLVLMKNLTLARLPYVIPPIHRKPKEGKFQDLSNEILAKARVTP
jgi:hypothetical protein